MLIKAACGYNAGPNYNSSDYPIDRGGQNYGYGVQMKMCLGQELTGNEKIWARNHFCADVDKIAKEWYQKSHGLVP